MFTTFRFLTCFFELNYYAKVSHGKSNFEIIFFGFIVCETTPIVVGNSFGFFFGVFVDAEKLVFIEKVLLNFLHISHFHSCNLVEMAFNYLITFNCTS